MQTPSLTPAPPPTTGSRRDRIKTMRDGLVDDRAASQFVVVPAELQSETARRLEQTLQETMADKLDALERVKSLEEALLEARRQQQKEVDLTQAPSTPVPASHTTTSQPKALQKLLQISDRDGEEAALQWARAQVVGVPPLSNESSSSLLTSSPGPRLLLDQHHPSRAGATLTRRVAAPAPKYFDSDDTAAPPSMVVLERQWIAHFREAATCIPYEFDSEIANFCIRRPYGMETDPDIFEQVSETPHTVYSKRAHVSTISTVEVAATVKANGSYFLLRDVASVRYQTSEGEWKMVDNVDTLDRPLGTLSFIDNDGVERDYSLDQLLEEALLVREQYGRTLTSTALGFKERPPVVQTVSAKDDHKPSSSSIAVDTSDIPYPPATIEIQKKEESASPRDSAKSGNAPPSVEEPSTGGSGNVLAGVLGTFFKTIFGFIWWIVVGLPLAIVRTTLVSTVAIVLLSMVYLYLYEEHHNGHSLSLLSTTQYHSNAAGLGIM